MSIGVQVWSQTASANSTADTNINWAEGMAPSQVNDSARAEMASVAKFRDDNNGTLATSGTTAAYTLVTNQVEGALTEGYTVAVKFHATNDNAATLAVDSLAAKNIQLVAGTNITSGIILGNTVQRLKYDSGSTAWLLQGSNAVQSLGTDNLADGAVTYNKIQTPGASVLLGNPSTSTSTGYREIVLGTNLSFSAQTLNAGNNTPVVSIFTSTGTATWQSTTKGGNFPLYISVRMVGGGGGGGAVGTNNGVVGTDTSFNNWTAAHGAGGITNNGAGGAGGSGGTNGTGTLLRRITGQSGTAGFASVVPQGAPGGSSPLGGGGTAVAAAGGVNAVANTGSGGSGGNSGGASGAGGGAGEYVEFLITSPSTAYSYTVGGGGAGGAAGTQAGGNGAAGRVEVISYWQ